MTTTFPTIQRDDEIDAAQAIEAGVLARAALTGLWPSDATVDELRTLIDLGNAARDRLLAAHAGLVQSLVRQERRGPLDDDLLQEGWLALAEALVRYDHRVGPFGTYAYSFVRASVRLAAGRQKGHTERQLKGLRAIRATESALSQAWGRAPSSAEVGSHLGRDRSWVEWCGIVHAATEPADLDLVPAGGSGQDQDHGTVMASVDALPEPERTVLLALYPRVGEGATTSDLAVQFGVTARTIRRMARRGLDRIRSVIDQSEAA